MKTKSSCTFDILCATFALTVLMLFSITPGASAQGDTVTINAAEFHRLVYSGHILTEMAHKPELDAVCQTLVELHCRNPQADPAALAAVCQQALERFRTNAPVYLRSTEARDEILVAYLEAFHQIPAHANFNPATWALLDILMGRPGQNPPTNVSSATLLHASNQGLIHEGDKLGQRQALVDACTRRAQANASFRQALDLIVGAESGVLFAHPAGQIISHNPALAGNPAMLSLLVLSQSVPDGHVEISMAAIDTLFTNEIGILQATIETNRQVNLEILQYQSDLMAYLADTNLVETLASYEAERKAAQTNLLAASHASMNSLSALMETRSVTRSKYARGLGNAVSAIADTISDWSLNTKFQAINRYNKALQFSKLSKGLSVSGGLVSAAISLISSFAFPSPEEIMLKEIAKVKQMIYELGTEMHGRFDQVDRSLNTIQTTLNETLSMVNEVEYGVEQVRQGLLVAQMDLHRLERQLFTSFNEQQRKDLKDAINAALYWENFNPAPMTWALYSQTPNYENTFYTYATDLANNAIGSPSSFASDDLTDRNLKQQLDARPLNANLNYLKAVLYDRTTNSAFNPLQSPVLANPQDWFVSAYAYLQLALENPIHFRAKGLRLPSIITRGGELTNFLRNLTFSGSSTNINWPLYGTLLDNYSAKLDTFASQVQTAEHDYADRHLYKFALDTWRDWAAGAPCFTATRTTVEPVPLYAQGVTRIAAGESHSLGLKLDGTVVGWGRNDSGQATIPANATNVVALAAGIQHSVALRADGTVIVWGGNLYGQANVPPGLSNVVAIAAGGLHNLALRSDGTVVGWGYNNYGQTTIPASAADVVAIAAGGLHSLALRSDRTVVAWGFNSYGQTNVPATATNVVAVAAGTYHSIALKADGTIVGWGENSGGQTTIPASAANVVAIAAGRLHNMALKADGTIVGWGYSASGQVDIPAGLSNVMAIAAGGFHSLAVKTDGSIVGWGDNAYGQSAPPHSIPGGATALAAGGSHSLALRIDGTVAGWGDNGYGQTTIPARATNVVAVAAGGLHSLALKADGTVVGWGLNDWGQTTIPASASNVVAVAAGFRHSLALRADGKVVGWGRNDTGERSIPASATNAVAIAAGGYAYSYLGIEMFFGQSLALRADGRVVGWGDYLSATPASATNVVAIAAGGGHCLALKANGTVVGWGSTIWNNYGQANPPASATNVVAIAAGAYHSLALRADGTVVGWGRNSQGQTAIPAGLTNVVAIAAGESHSLALRADGTVVGWGWNSVGQINVPSSMARYESYAASRKTTINNSVSSQFNGQLVNGPQWVPGAPAMNSPGYALSFDGLDDSVEVPNFGEQIPNNEVTVEFWQRGRANNLQSTFGLEPDDERNRFQGHVPYGQTVYWDFGNDIQNGRLSYVPTNSLVGSWQHFALVAKTGSNGFLRIYRNGILEAQSQPGPAVPKFGSKTLRLGRLSTAGHFAGELDEFRIWNTVRTQLEVDANRNRRLSGTESNLVAYWTFDDAPGSSIPELTRDAIKVAAGQDFSLALRNDGTVVAWGVENLGQCAVPANLTGVADLAVGPAHSVALKNNGSVVAWGWNGNGQANVPPEALYDVVAVAAGRAHSLALRNDGTVVAWGCDNAGQSTVPDTVSNVVAIAAGAQHSLALKADSTVVAWGAANAGGVPYVLANVVAIAAGDWHSLALLNNGGVVAWGWSGYGQTNVPAGARSNVVAIAAFRNHSLALKADGTVVAWGCNGNGQTKLPAGLGNVVALAAGGRHNVFLMAHSGDSGGSEREFVLASVPRLVTKQWLPAVGSHLLSELDGVGTVNTRAVELSGAKALLQAVLELGMPYTMERDDVLQGFFYGTEALADLAITKDFFVAETNRLATTPGARPRIFEEVAGTRFATLANRLNERLDDLQATGQPEIPRIVGHTLRLLNLLRDAWTQPANSPPPALEIGGGTNALETVLYGEPYAHYTLQCRDNLSGPGWMNTTTTNWHNEQLIMPPVSGGPQRFYRALLAPP